MRALLVALAVLAAGALAYLGVDELLALRAMTAPPSPRAFVQAAWSVYRFAPGHELHAGRLGLDCKACHRSTKEGSFDRPGPAPCEGCHEDASRIEHALVALDRSGHRTDAGVSEGQVSDCMACHGFGPDPEKKATDCLSCHAHARGHAGAIVMHAELACESCHRVHENQVEPLRCGECHDIASGHPHGARSAEQGCLDCHGAHDSAASAPGACAACHVEGTRSVSDTAAPEIPAGATFEGHRCTGCHAPHGFNKQTVTDCASCHREVHVLEGKGHKECTACHAPHAVKNAVAQNVCVSCHEGLSLQHNAAGAKQSACTDCHAPHPASAAQVSTREVEHACARCHADVGAAPNRAHAQGVACTSCHTPHAFAWHGGEAACGTCHGAELTRTAQNAGHARCAACHQNLPHGATLTPSACTQCHAEVHPRRGHDVCTQCHEPHSGQRNDKTCASCHGAEAHAGIHSPSTLSCTSCHDQHTSALKAGVGDCSACHKRAELPGLHETEKHTPCTSCHAPHAERLPGARAVCLNCHRDRVDHQPEATRCEGCHQFVSASHGAGRAKP